ncbi:DUF2793 domain-containing protein [Sphingomonas sp. dw_22]|uniref:DUF2793 domain-containing protein n=1 Tax=Sphingomonas sp. dw_22 TaxID=2721175 RepID=UPI001BD380A4|nr:DUF2793 domain-containing protein [Sphingomonas sp. dw_22]
MILRDPYSNKPLVHFYATARLDIAVQGAAVAAGANMPPADPVTGGNWILGAAPEGAWAGHAGEVAGWTEGGWRFLAPFEGMRLWVVADQAFALFSEGEWVVGRSYGRLIVEGRQVVGPRVSAIAEPAGGTTVDTEARAAIMAVLEALREHGLVDTI